MSELRTLGEALAWGRQRVDNVDAKLLLREAAGVSAATLVAFPERGVASAAATQYVKWIMRREAGEPVAHLLGWREFYGREFRVTTATLIPRPDTELLVELALERMHAFKQPQVLDLGTGTGAIAVSLACEITEARLSAVDLSADALAVARDNATKLGATVEFLHGSWLAPVAGRKFDLIVSNPPYIELGDPHLAQGDLRFEPATALVAGTDGLDDIRAIMQSAPAHLQTGGWLLLEHGYDQAERVRALLADSGFSEVDSWRDLAGIERVSGGRWGTA